MLHQLRAMKHLTAQLFAIFIHLGGFGLLLLGILDSSFLVMPMGNDLLVIAMTARHHALMPYYAAMAALGSTLGSLLVDIVSRKGGEEMIEKHVPKRRLKYIEGKVKKNAGWAVGFAALMPPPFPFTPFVVVAAALEYPRRKMLAVIAATRLLRFGIEGGLAILFGRRILHWAGSRAFQYVVIGLIAISILASVLSVLSWVRKSKKSGGAEERAPKLDPAHQSE
jgi:membrane protein YqaA with SNARE-associated domain